MKILHDLNEKCHAFYYVKRQELKEDLIVNKFQS
jgi:hypothetical protein